MVLIVHDGVCVKKVSLSFLPRRGDQIGFTMGEDTHCVAIVDQVVHMIDLLQVQIIVRDLEEKKEHIG